MKSSPITQQRLLTILLLLLTLAIDFAFSDSNPHLLGDRSLEQRQTEKVVNHVIETES